MVDRRDGTIVARAVARTASRARRGLYGRDSGHVVALSRGAMELSPGVAARVGAQLLRAALEADPTALADDEVGADVLAIGRLVLALDPVAA